jgi:hypothetical protein
VSLEGSPAKVARVAKGGRAAAKPTAEVSLAASPGVSPAKVTKAAAKKLAEIDAGPLETQATFVLSQDGTAATAAGSPSSQQQQQGGRRRDTRARGQGSQELGSGSPNLMGSLGSPGGSSGGRGGRLTRSRLQHSMSEVSGGGFWCGAVSKSRPRCIVD